MGKKELNGKRGRVLAAVSTAAILCIILLDLVLYKDSYRLLVRSSVGTMLIVLAAAAVFFVLTGEKRRAKRLRRSRRAKKSDEEPKDFTAQDQRKFQVGITAIFVGTMIAAIVLCGEMTVSESRIKMQAELQKYNYAVGDWVLEQKSILDMLENVVVAKPEILDSYEGMVKFLDDITRRYPKISATYIANPAFAHGHPMVMNNGWVPEPDYTVEERSWYVSALTAESFNITEPYYDARTGKYCITFSKMAQSEQGKFYGVLAIDFYLDELTDILGESYSAQGYAFLADKNGLIIDHPDPGYKFQDGVPSNIHDLVYDRFYGEDGMVVFRDYDGKYKVGASMEEGQAGFRIIVVKSWWSIYGNVLEYMLLFLAVFGVCIFAVNTVMHRMIRWQQKANEDLREMALSAIRAEQSKSLFFSNMSHEIRTPINAVLGMNEMILRECGDEQILSYAENIQSAGNTLLFLLNDILDMSKIESGKMEIIPAEYQVGDLVLDLWNVICLKAREKGLAILFHLAPDMPRKLYGDDLRIKQVVTNLLTNAVKYTPEGSVEMEVSYQKVSEKKLILKITVKDTGIGIRQEDIGELFEKYKRLDEKRNRNIEGTGLGMNIAMSLIEMMDGDIKIDSVYQQGSIFTVTIPQEIMDETPVGNFEELKVRHRPAGNGGRKRLEAPDARVLVVDDNDINLEVFKALLERTRVRIDMADSGRKCLELAKKEKYHIIFMDHMMPEMDGIETLHALRSLADCPNADTPVIVLTANAVMGAREMYLKEGFADYLAKPVEGEVLERVILEYLPGELVRAVESPPDESGQKTRGESAQDSGGAVCGENAEGGFTKECEAYYLRQGISLSRGLSYAGGSLDVYLDLVEMFLRDKSRQEQRLKDFLQAGDIAGYGALTHALKGNARMLGADRLADIVFAHEKAGKAGQLEYAVEHWDELAAEWEKCCQGLDAFYHEYREDKPEKYAPVSGGETVEISREELDEVIALLDEYQTPQAAGRLKGWLEKPLEPKMHRRLRDALLAIEEEFDEERAMEILRG